MIRITVLAFGSNPIYHNVKKGITLLELKRIISGDGDVEILFPKNTMVFNKDTILKVKKF